MHKFSLIIWVLIVLVIANCNNPFAPGIADENTPGSALLTQQKTPEEVLDNFKYAYTYKDSLVYSEVLDSTFIFISTNYNEYPPTPIEWGRDTELRTTARMFRYFNTLELVWNTLTQLDTTQATPEYLVTFTLTLDGGRAIPPLNGEVLFRFILRAKKYYIQSWEDQRI
jgi:hypothetical protein